ncbi:MAG: class I SAM-dependent methyltransferase [candidate division KSB1 bacterium]|nr:class I SAM-dependent methyltransferase [candidate division KSB1 bacterium]
MQLPWSVPRRETVPYARLAEIYDYVMRHVDYQLWAEHIDLLLTRARVPRGPLLEMAAGSGSLSWHLRRLGWAPVLCDLSPQMLRQAAAKFRQRGVSVPMWVADMCHIATLRRFPAAVCVYDSMNYLLCPEDWALMLQGTADCLEESGVLVFDVCTALNSRRNFRHYRERESGPGFTYTRKSRYVDAIQLQINQFDIELASAPGVVFRETHRQRIYSLREVEAMVEASPFFVEASHCDFSLKPGSEQCERVHFVLRRRGSA